MGTAERSKRRAAERAAGESGGVSSVFGAKLRAAAPEPAGRRWLFVPYDQLSDRVGPLSREKPRDLGIVLVETRWKPAQRRYHRQKVALVLASQRHFALEQAARGVAVRYVVGEKPYAALLAPLVAELGALRAMTPAERELRADLAPLVEKGARSSCCRTRVGSPHARTSSMRRAASAGAWTRSTAGCAAAPAS